MGYLSRIATVLNLRRTTAERFLSRDRVAWHGGRAAGVYISHEEAIRLSAVWACVTVIAKAIASSSWDVFEEDSDGNRTHKRNTPIWRLLNVAPNTEMGAFSFIEAALIVAMIWGNFYAEIERDMLGRPVALWPLDPLRCTLDREDFTGRLILRVQNFGRPESILYMEDVFQIHGPGIDGVAGFDIVRVAMQSLGHTKAAETFGAAFFANNASPGGVLSSDQRLNEEQKKSLKADLDEKKGRKAFGYLVLDGGLKWASPIIDQRSSQFIESRAFQVKEVCRWFGVPPHKIADLAQSTNNNIEHQGIEFGRDALVPWCERLRQEADGKLTPVRGSIRTRIDIDWQSEGDAKTRAETDTALANSGIATRNELRKRRGMNAMKGKGADTLTVQSAMVPIDMIQQLAEKNSQTPAPGAPSQGNADNAQ